MPPYTVDSPAKKQSKWSAEEDALIIELRGSGMKWEDISKRLPGRSAISCRLHYQNYLERRSEWDEERKNKLARLYERFKPEMWAKVAEEMQVPWRAAEAMHWQLGEADMARRAGVTPFSLSAMAVDSSTGPHRQSPSRPPYAHSPAAMSGGSVGGNGSGLSPRYGRGGPATHPSLPPPPSLMMERESNLSGPRQLYQDAGSNMYPYQQSPQQQPQQPPPPPPPPQQQQPQQQQQQQPQPSYYSQPGPGLPPIQSGGPSPFAPQDRMGGGGGGGGGAALPSLAEITTGVSPYSTPAYSLGASPAPSQTSSPVPGLAAFSTAPRSGYGFGGPGPSPALPGLSYPPIQMGSGPELPGIKRRASPNFEPRDARESRRRYMPSPRYDDDGRGM